jgi:hypothetical protein
MHRTRLILPLLLLGLIVLPPRLHAEPVDLSVALLQRGDFPTGWVFVGDRPPSSVRGITADCGLALPEDLVPLDYIDVWFQRPPTSVVSHEVIAWAPGDAARYLTFTRDLAQPCEWEHDGETLRWWLEDAPDLGDEAILARQTARGGRAGLNVDIVYIRRGDLVAVVHHAIFTSNDNITPDRDLTLRLARFADERLGALTMVD